MLNRVTFIGRVGADPEVKTLDNGTMVGRTRIATDKTIKDEKSEGGFRKITQWHNIQCWRYDAQRLEKIKAGDLILFEGEATHREHTGIDGIKRYYTEFVGSVRKLPTTKHTPTQSLDESNVVEVVQADFNEVDDLPF